MKQLYYLVNSKGNAREELDAVFQALQILPNLKGLMLNENQLCTALPEESGKLTQSPRFVASHQRITTLPDSLGNLQSPTIVSCQQRTHSRAQ